MPDYSNNAIARTVLIANPSSDVYGSDLQMLESITAMTGRGWRVIVATPADGALVVKIRERGAEVLFTDFPVLRRADATRAGIAALARSSMRSVRALRRVIRQVRPDAIYVNTVTVPWWIAAARLSGVGVVVHVHEAELEDKKFTRLALNAPLLLANALIHISEATRDATLTAVPGLRSRSSLIYNGVRGPRDIPLAPFATPDGPIRLAVVARLSPRKAADVALEAVAILRAGGRDVRIDLCGTPFAGYEWFEAELRARADMDDLRGAVTFSGYVSPIWPSLEAADIILAPSLREPFGNAVVEAQLSARPVIASRALGHTESIEDGVSGLLVPAGDPEAMADAVTRILDDPRLAASLSYWGRQLATERFSTDRYNREIADVVAGTFGPARSRGPAQSTKPAHRPGRHVTPGTA